MIVNKPIPPQSALRAAITAAYRADETQVINERLQQAEINPDACERIENKARELVIAVRKERLTKSGLDAFLQQYDLSSYEGVALMCLAEALLRVPDEATVHELIRDKITPANWQSHVGKSESFFVNAGTWGLLLTGKLMMRKSRNQKNLSGALQTFLERSSAPVIHAATKQAMKILGHQFVMGRNIKEALKRAVVSEAKGYRYSYDMLGEAARTAQDAERYFQSYSKAIAAIGSAAAGRTVQQAPGISVKLSALHPRYEFAQRDRVLPQLIDRVRQLALQAKAVNIGFTIDAEEADRLDLSLDIIEAVFTDPAFDGWEGFGLAVQAYQKRAYHVLDWLIALARQQKRRFMVRLVKGAYWDYEIKDSQVKGFSGYPVFTRKPSTDVSYIACAKKMITAPDAIYPQFATHNAYSVAVILELMGNNRDFEFQCLHGMGHPLYDQLVGKDNLTCRIYAPVGTHEDLLAYLVRRLLENGANTSFVNRIMDEQVPIKELVINPVIKVQQLMSKPHSKIPLPLNLYGDSRKNSLGLDLSNVAIQQELKTALDQMLQKKWQAMPLIAEKSINDNQSRPVTDPSDRTRVVGTLIHATKEQVELALKSAAAASERWDATPIEQRASCLDKAADLFEQHYAEFILLAVREGGKNIFDALGEVREAVDYCRYYAEQARISLTPKQLPGPTGEFNQLQMHGRGVAVCISPWNFPLAIFIGQVTAALAAGNTVIAKPSDQTPLIATRAIQILHEAGIPKDAMQLLPGSGRVVGAALIADLRTSLIIFTGSTETARFINQTLANREGAIIPFIAETGGQNVMIADSTALPEQLVADVVISAFNSAGQRCSALRVLFLQEEIADKVIAMLKGAMAELQIGDPGLLNTDVGPVIDESAQETLQKHLEFLSQNGKLIHQVKLSESCKNGTYFGPSAYEIPSLSLLKREVFGPILHVIRYRKNDLDKVIAAINETGYGLTFGIHTRVNETVDYLQQHVHVGNVYVNRNMIGAVVGVQPFGGERLSGTGPKAGGPHYLLRMCTEKTLTINTTAAGGNATLMTLEE
jgi:RHH-type proline utilization regulon transcriptional repressor/proline dehydrogenase/delta 1-pyrroline-5-carboxylate dehydrogenase